jgi:hypothetical protein
MGLCRFIVVDAGVEGESRNAPENSGAFNARPARRWRKHPANAGNQQLVSVAELRLILGEPLLRFAQFFV